MKLEQIEQRLSLFTQFQQQLIWPGGNMIIIPPRRYGVTEMIRHFEETGILFYKGKDHTDEIRVSNFDDWLFKNKHFDLVDWVNYPVEKGLIDYIKTEGVQIPWPPQELPPYFRENEVWSTNKSGLYKYFQPSWPSQIDEYGFKIHNS